MRWVDVGDATGDRVLDWDHAELGLAGADGGKRILEGGAPASARNPGRPRGGEGEFAPGSPGIRLSCSWPLR